MNKSYKKNYNELIKNSFFYLKNNNLNKAKKLLEKAISLDSKEILAYINLSNIYILENKINKCTNLLYNYLESNKLNTQIINHLGKIYLKFNLINELLNLKKLFLKKKHLKKDLFYINYLFGIGFEEKENILEAVREYKKSIQLNNKFIESYLRLCNLFEKTNKISLLKETINLANDNHFLDPRLSYFEALYSYRKKEYKNSQSIIINRGLVKDLKNQSLYFIDILNLQFKNFEKLKDYKKAFKTIKERNVFISNQEENKKYNKRKIIDTINIYKKFYTNKKLKNNYKNFNNHVNIVFIVGFPRSGTTLLDTILRSHSKTLVLEEKPYILNLRHDYFKKNNNKLESIDKITNKEIIEIQREYLKQINYDKDNKKIIIDKFPLTIMEIGFIKKIFPESKIILAMRHPCDSVLSCFFSYFKMNDAMINFLDLKDTINFYNYIFEFFHIFNQSLVMNHLVVKYEDLVLNFDTTIKKILNFLNISYEDRLSRFYETAQKRNKINTPSYNQVIQPLYTSSIGRWKKYNDVKFIEKDLKKWIEKYNY